MRVALAMVLFLTAVSYVFSPFVADLHARGEREKLDALFKSITRWTVAGTIPVLLLMLLAPDAILRLFGGENFTAGATALRILVIGQAINVSVGAAGFVLIMAGRTRLGPDRLRAVGRPRRRAVAPARAEVRHQRSGCSAGDHDRCSNWLRLVLVKRFVGIFPWDRPYARLAIPAIGCGLAMLAAQAVLRATRAGSSSSSGSASRAPRSTCRCCSRFGLTAGERDRAHERGGEDPWTSGR